MNQGGRSIRGREKMHALFIELYVTGDLDDLDDPDEAEVEWRAERSRARARRSVLQKRVKRRA
jgi:hypothetical protein